MPVTKTVLAKDIDMENLDIRYDKSVRRILDELEDKIPYEGRIIYDIRFSIILPDGSSRKIIINVEAQQKGNPGYSLLNRGVFYAARLISAQLSVEFTNDGSDKEQYDNMKQVSAYFHAGHVARQNGCKNQEAKIRKRTQHSYDD